MSNPPSDALMVNPSEPWQSLGWQKTRMSGKRKAVYISDHWKINRWNLPQESQRLMVQMMFIFPLSIFFSDVWVVCREFSGMFFLKQSVFFRCLKDFKKNISIQIVHIKKTFFPIYDLWFLLFWYWNGFMIHMNRHFHTRGAAEEASPPMLPPAMRRTSKKRRKALPPLPPMPPPPPPPLALEDGEVPFGELR